MRRHGYAGRYPYDFTIRSRLPSGNPIELAKIVNGEGDWLFYGHANAAYTGFDLCWLLDLRFPCRADPAGFERVFHILGRPPQPGRHLLQVVRHPAFLNEPQLVRATSGLGLAVPSPW